MPKRMASTPRTTSDHQIPDTILESISISHFLLFSGASHARLGWLWAVAHASQAHLLPIGSKSVPSVPSDHCVLAVAAPLRLSEIILRCCSLFRSLFCLCLRERWLLVRLAMSRFSLLTFRSPPIPSAVHFLASLRTIP